MTSPAISLRSTTWIVLAIALVAAPHAARLPLWLSGFAMALCIWRLYLARTRLALPPRWLLIFIVAAGAAAILLEFRTLFGREAGVALLVLMISLKLMETRTQRDGMVLAFIGYFLVITNFFYTQSIPTALYLLTCVWLITAAMIGLQYRDEPNDSRGQLKTSAMMLLQSAPLMLVFFLLFPRIEGPLWGMPSDAFAGVTGLSESMSPGTMNKLALSDEVALRATFSARIPLPNQLYWRGPVLLDYDGRTWTTTPRPLRNLIDLDRRENPVRYTVTVEPHSRRWLFALDLPGLLPPRTAVDAEYQLLSQTPVTSRLRYEIESFLDYGIGMSSSPAAQRRMLALPPGFNPRTLELGQQLRARHADNETIMNAALALLREQQFVYTLEPPLLGRHTADEFLFQTKRGFCEHFASAFVVLMRSAGVPARVVTGYLGGEYNTLGNYLIVRQSDAHAWTEVWLDQRGWVRVDPTNAAAPARAESGLAAALPQRATLSRGLLGNNALVHRLGLTLDSIANAWNQTVLGYNLETQRALLYRAGFEDNTWRTLTLLLIGAAAIVTALLALITLRNRLRAHDPALEIYRAFCHKSARAGLVRRDAEGPHDFATRIAAQRPDLADAAHAITQRYIALRYNNNSNRIKYLKELRQRVRQFSV